MKRVILACLAILALAAFRFVPQKNVTQADNTAQGGGTIYVDTDITADTACAASLSDLSASTDLTPSCAHTGPIIVAGFDQVAVELEYALDSGTAVVMQCDISQGATTAYAPMYTEDSTGAKAIRTWTWTSSATPGRVRHNFNVNARLLRCRAWVTGGGSSATVRFKVRLASSVGG